MKRLNSSLLCLLVLLIALITAFFASQFASAQTPTPIAFKVEPIKQLRKGVDAWPLIVNPATAAELRVNASLTRLNNRLAAALRDCDKGAREEAKLMGTAKKGENPAEADWSRKVQVTMEGPRFLSMVATEDMFCGGAHPDSDTMAMVFDMTTGTPVNWVQMVAKSAGPSASSDTVSDGSTIGALVLPELQKINLAAAVADCKDAFQEAQAFLLWPDAKNGTLVAEAFDLPHVVQACAEEIPLTMSRARKLGFDESLLTAIEQAHSKAAAARKP